MNLIHNQMTKHRPENREIFKNTVTTRTSKYYNYTLNSQLKRLHKIITHNLQFQSLSKNQILVVTVFSIRTALLDTPLFSNLIEKFFN